MRGSAVLELAIVLPLAVAILLYSLFFTELIRARLRLLQATRFAAWELTAYPLSDFGRADHDRAFENASERTLSETKERFAAVNSAGDGAGGALVASFDGVDLRLRRSPASGTDLPLGGRRGGGAWAASIFGALNGGLGAVLRSWKINDAGLVSAETSMRLRSRLSPRLSAGSLSNLALKSRLTLLADAWTLHDGGDAMMRGRRAGWHRSGSHPSGLYLQVSRMTFLGLRERLERLPIVGSMPGFLRGLAPAPMGTFVVSHNYGPNPDGELNRGCNHLPGYPRSAIGGLNNLSRFSQLDEPRPECFDTAPFRDQTKYQDSLYLRMFEGRGSWFMGCKNFGADDPSTSADLNSADEGQKVNCG